MILESRLQKGIKRLTNDKTRDSRLCASRNGSAHLLILPAPSSQVEVAALPGLHQRGPGTSLGLAPSSGLLRGWHLLGHLSDHVVQDASIVEVRELHISVEPHHGLEGLPSVQLQEQRGRALLKAGLNGDSHLRETAWLGCPLASAGAWYMPTVPAADRTSGLCTQQEPRGFMCPPEVEEHCRINDTGARHMGTKCPLRTAAMSDTVMLCPKSFLDMLWAAEVSGVVL